MVVILIHYRHGFETLKLGKLALHDAKVGLASANQTYVIGTRNATAIFSSAASMLGDIKKSAEQFCSADIMFSRPTPKTLEWNLSQGNYDKAASIISSMKAKGETADKKSDHPILQYNIQIDWSALPNDSPASSLPSLASTAGSVGSDDLSIVSAALSAEDRELLNSSLFHVVGSKTTDKDTFSSMDDNDKKNCITAEKKKEMVMSLIELGADVNSLKDGISPLMRAASSGDSEMVKLLCENSGNIQVNLESANDVQFTKTALHFAAINGDPKTIQTLLDNGANIDAREGHSQDTPLILAVNSGNIDAVKTLVDMKANPNAGSRFGRSAIHIAAKSGNAELVKTLASSSTIDMRKRDVDGNTPFQLAKERKNFHSKEKKLFNGITKTEHLAIRADAKFSYHSDKEKNYQEVMDVFSTQARKRLFKRGA